MLKAHRIEKMRGPCFVISLWTLERRGNEAGWAYEKTCLGETCETLEEAKHRADQIGGFRLKTGDFVVNEFWLPFEIGFEE